MVAKILESMMPVMVKELSYRIVEELRCEKTYSEMEAEYWEELNP